MGSVSKDHRYLYNSTCLFLIKLLIVIHRFCMFINVYINYKLFINVYTLESDVVICHTIKILMI